MRRSSVQSGKYQDLGDLLRALMALPPATYIAIKPENFRPSEGYYIEMGSAGITNATSKTPIMGTGSLRTCMGIALCNPKSKTGGITHLVQAENDPARISPASKKALISLLSTARNHTSQLLEVRIIGPYFAPYIEEIMQILNKMPNVHFLSADFQGKSYPSAVGIDTRCWEQGLLKGSNNSGINIGQIAHDVTALQNYLKECVHIVDIGNLPLAPHYKNGLFDARVKIKHTGANKPTAIHPDTLSASKLKKAKRERH